MAVRMRFPAQAVEELHREDPGCQITLNFVRGLAKSGKIPCVHIGRRYLLNYDALLEYLANPEPCEPPASVGGIHRIAE